LPTNITPSVSANSPGSVTHTLPANLILTDNNTAQSTTDITFIRGQQWSANFTLVNPTRTDQAQISHVLRMDPEAFAAWNPDATEAKFMGVLRGDPILQDLTVTGLPTTADHIVGGTFLIQNPFWRTTINCSARGDGPLVFPRHVFRSINCGPQSRCNGTLTLTVVQRGPVSQGTTTGTPNSIGKVGGFDRVLVFFGFTLPTP
jgi:hypothetical protein